MRTCGAAERKGIVEKHSDSSTVNTNSKFVNQRMTDPNHGFIDRRARSTCRIE